MTKEPENSGEEGREQAGDEVESAGETTAAGTVSGPENTKPVGEDTSIKVSDEPGPRRD